MRVGAVPLPVALAWIAALACAGPAAAPRPEGKPRAPAVVARAWPEADALFQRDPRWLGGDAAVSVALDDERVLWLFGDSFIAAGAQPPAVSRRGARMVRNSVAVQRGRDPSRAELRFFWRTDAAGAPASFFSEQGACWLWPGHGLHVSGVLTLFAMRVCPDAARGGALGFRVVGWTAWRVNDARAEPDAWQPAALATPETGELIVGAAVLAQGEHVYAYAVRASGDHTAVLLRWRLAEFARGDLMRPEYFGGAGRGFGSGPPTAVLERAATEFSVSSAPGGYVAVHARGFGAAPIALRFAPRLTGPFTPPRDVYVPEQAGRDSVLIYAARAHPELAGGDLVVTYNKNSLDADALLDDLSLYFPRFVRLDLPAR